MDIVDMDIVDSLAGTESFPFILVTLDIVDRHFGYSGHINHKPSKTLHKNHR